MSLLRNFFIVVFIDWCLNWTFTYNASLIGFQLFCFSPVCIFLVAIKTPLAFKLYLNYLVQNSFTLVYHDSLTVYWSMNRDLPTDRTWSVSELLHSPLLKTLSMESMITLKNQLIFFDGTLAYSTIAVILLFELLDIRLLFAISQSHELKIWRHHRSW